MMLLDRYNEGWSEGRSEGERLGEERGSMNIAQGMKKKGFSISDIMELTGLSKEKVMAL